MLKDKSIVLQGHAARALSKIAKAHQKAAPGILRALAQAKENFPGNRVGYLVEAMEAFAGMPSLVTEARAFVEPFLESEINAVKTKARRAMKRLG